MHRWWLWLCLGACGGVASPEPDLGPVAAWVNGRDVTEAEVELVQRRPGSRRLERDEALDLLIDLELQAQAAEALGLHEERSYQAIVARLEAQAREGRRAALAKQYRMNQVATLPQIPEAVARAWFDANRGQIRTEFDVQQILSRSRPDAEKAARALADGLPFDEVAAQFPSQATRPPPIRFDGLAPGWWAALRGLSPGQSTAAIPMTGGRFAVLHLVERRDLGEPVFDEVRGRIVAVLQSQKLEDTRAETPAKLRRTATIEIAPAPDGP